MQSQRLKKNPGIHSSHELLGTLSTQAVFRSFSAHLGRLTGWSDSEWIGRPLQIFIHPEDSPQIKERFTKVVAGETARFDLVRCLTRTGGHIAWTLSFVPQIENGVVSDVLMLGQLSESETSPDERASHPLDVFPLYSGNERRPSNIIEYAGLGKLLEAMLGNAPVGFALSDEQMHFICLNQTFSEMTGFSPEQQLGRPLRDLLPSVARVIEPIMQNVLTSGECAVECSVELEETNRIDSCRYAQMSFYPIPDLRGGFCGVATIAIDTTARMRSEAQLKETADELARSNLALEEFSYMASHDLKEPLRTISSFVELLKDKCAGKLDGEGNHYLAYAVDGATRMQQLIDKVLEYSRAGKVERAPTNVDCNEVVRTVLADLKVAIEEGRVSATHDPLPTVLGDKTLLLRIFQNLIANAVKFRRPLHPAVHISARQELNAWVISVVDNGIGIDPSLFTSIFDPFRRLNRHSEYTGSGLGLAICKKNVERQGGQIYVTSEKGKGSTFSFTIPIPLKKGLPQNA